MSERQFVVLTDTSANIPYAILKERGIDILPFHFYVDGKECAELNTETFDGKAFFDMMRAGKRVTTSQINPYSFTEFFGSYLMQGKDVLFISMSSGISGSYNSAKSAAAMLKETYPERKIAVVDTRGASLGEGLVALKAAEYADAGMSLEVTAKKMWDLSTRMYNVFSVDDLTYLRNTGRLSNAAAVVGMVLQIKPILKGDPEGKIVSFKKVRGRKAAIETLAKRWDEMAVNHETQTIGIAHADCAEDAEMLINLINRNHPPKQIINVMYEPVTGSHVGPGTLALFFESDETCRER